MAFEAARREAPPSVRSLMRTATAAAHERMHAHPGLNAAASGAIALRDYRALLSRLLGFHRPFERWIRAAADACALELDLDARARSPFLIEDLENLGVRRDAIDRLPDWTPSFELAGKGAVLGSLYVIEGSTLGGLQIARALDGRLGGTADEARRFFLGRGERHGALWGAFVRQLETLSERPQSTDDAIDAAIATFSAFEDWMQGWATEPAP